MVVETKKQVNRMPSDTDPTSTSTLSITPAEATSLLQHVFTDDEGHQRNNDEVVLTGRPVLIPYGSCRRAFVEGELYPERVTRRRKDTVEEGEVMESEEREDEEEEMVEVLQKDNSWKSMSVDDVKESLMKLTMRAKENVESKNTIPKTSGTTKVSSSSSSSSSKTTTTSNQTTPSSTKKDSNDTNVDNDYFMDLPSNLIDIQEEYDADGRQIYGQAVDVTSKLQSLWTKNKDKADENDDTTGETNQSNSADITSEQGDDASSTTETVQPKTATSKKVISDEEYDQLARRLEELARLEEEAEEAAKLQHFRPVPVSSISSSTANKSSTSKGSNGGGGGGGLQFKKGFLNKASKPKGPTEKKTTRITIDTTKNTVQEIPSRVSNPQVIPSKEHSSNQVRMNQQRQTQQLDSQLFSGQIQERQSQFSESQTAQSLSNQAPQPPQKEKRMSRFARERLK